MKVIENFLPEEEFNAIVEEVAAASFPWFFDDGILYKNSGGSSEYQFTHMVWYNNEPQSPVFKLLQQTILKRLNIEFLFRIKLNLNPVTETHKYKDLFHVDQEGETTCKRKTAIFYLNTNNGYTLFKDGTRVDCVENKIVIFDANKEHTGVTATDTMRRLVLNINWLE